MLALIFTRKAADDHRLGFRMVDVGRDDGVARATSSRTNSPVMSFGIGAETLPGVLCGDERAACAASPRASCSRGWR